MSETDLDLRYDQVSFVATHNSYTGYFTGPPEGFAGSTVSLSTCLKDIHKFMTETDRNAVIGIGIEPYIDMKDQRTVQDLMTAFTSAGLHSLMFHPDRWTFNSYQEWPTLRQMIQNNWRLVVFSQNRVVKTGNPEVDRILDQYDYFVENVYDPGWWTSSAATIQKTFSTSRRASRWSKRC